MLSRRRVPFPSSVSIVYTNQSWDQTMLIQMHRLVQTAPSSLLVLYSVVTNHARSLLMPHRASRETVQSPCHPSPAFPTPSPCLCHNRHSSYPTTPQPHPHPHPSSRPMQPHFHPSPCLRPSYPTAPHTPTPTPPYTSATTPPPALAAPLSPPEHPHGRPLEPHRLPHLPF